jgi:2-amino-4-hydroxy-6-hydroxymethyldihydropteridine diphosphokinase
LAVPHPGLHQRAFVLFPLHEIQPDLHIPGHGPLHTVIAQCLGGKDLIRVQT